MSDPTKARGDRFVLSPREELAAGGSAEEFERRVKELFKSGYKHLVADLSDVPFIDSAGVRALVRGFTTAQRVGGTFTLAAPNPRVRDLLKAAHLDTVFPVVDSVGAVAGRRFAWRKSLPYAAGGLFVAGLVLAGWWLPQAGVESGLAFPGVPTGQTPAPLFGRFQPFLELFKLVVAATVGMLVTRVQRSYRPERPQTPSLEHAQVLLCVSGAMMMIIIGDNVARAFGIAGAAAIIRFRTPVEDPKDITILFLLMGLGMASGLGAFGVAGLGTLFLCGLLAVLERVGARKTRVMMVEIEAEGREFPMAHVQGVFARNRVVFEPREVSQAKAVAVRYHTLLGADQSLEDLSDQLMDGGRSAVRSVSWEVPKKTE
jgi:anti-anti-sigma factor